MSAGSPPLSIRLHRSLTATALFFFFALAFVAAPYWLIAESWLERFVSILGTIFLGALWTRLAAHDLELPLDRRAWGPAAILLGLMSALNLRALTSGIPWRGDESYHIAFALSFAKLVPTSWLAIAILASAAVLYLIWRKRRYAAVAGAALVVCCIAVYLLRQPPPLGPILRYPFFSRWFHALIPILLRPLAGLHHEIYYRIMPFLAAVLLSWLHARNVHSRSGGMMVFLGFAAATIPSVFFYSSILYLEMPAAVLMFLVCRDAEPMLSASFEELTTSPAWYALVLIGFIKETAAAFLLSFVALRIIVRLKSPPGSVPWWRLVGDELFMAISTLLPLALYLFYRNRFGDPRAFHFNPQNLLDLRLLPVILLSHLEQFGLSYLLFLGGILLLARHRQYRKALFLLLAVAATTLFHLLDGTSYAGYARFNLFVLPAVLAGSAVFLQFIGTKKKWYLPALTALILASNLAISPVNWDGTKKPYWGNYISKAPAEHYYPYREALGWLKNHDPTAVILFTGLGSDYYFDFYFDKLNWHPRYQLLRDSPGADSASMRDLLQTASAAGASSVVIRLEGNDPDEFREAPLAAGQWQRMVFRNMAQALVVYTK